MTCVIVLFLKASSKAIVRLSKFESLWASSIVMLSDDSCRRQVFNMRFEAKESGIWVKWARPKRTQSQAQYAKAPRWRLWSEERGFEGEIWSVQMIQAVRFLLRCINRVFLEENEVAKLFYILSLKNSKYSA
jgi:hypothetical protein